MPTASFLSTELLDWNIADAISICLYCMQSVYKKDMKLERDFYLKLNRIILSSLYFFNLNKNQFIEMLPHEAFFYVCLTVQF